MLLLALMLFVFILAINTHRPCLAATFFRIHCSFIGHKMFIRHYVPAVPLTTFYIPHTTFVLAEGEKLAENHAYFA